MKVKPSVQEIKGISFTEYEGVKVSKNKTAQELMGYRNEGHPGANAIDFPVELGYACPICGRSDEVNLEWSEYSGFIWCKKCNLDIPSCLCMKYKECKYEPVPHGIKPFSRRKLIEKQTAIFLSTIQDAIKRQRGIYKPRPICECGAKRWSEVFNSSTGQTVLRCTKCGAEKVR